MAVAKKKRCGLAGVKLMKAAALLLLVLGLCLALAQ